MKGKYKPEEKESMIKNIRMFCKARERVGRLFNDYSTIVSKAKFEATHSQGLRMLTPNQMLQWLPIAQAQVKSGSTFEKLLNKIRQIIYSLYRAKEITKKVYDTIFMNSKNSKTCDPHRQLLKHSDKISLKRSDKHAALSNVSIYFTVKNIKRSYENNKYKTSGSTWIKKFELPDGSYYASLKSHLKLKKGIFSNF